MFNCRYEYLDEKGKILQQTREQTNDFDEIIRSKMATFGTNSSGVLDFIYLNDIAKVWEEYVDAIGRKGDE